MIGLSALVYTIGAQPQAVYAQLPTAQPVQVVVDIVPLHAIVQDLLAGIAQPSLLLDGTQSPHFFQLKPSQAGLLGQADLVILVGGGLIPPLDMLAAKDANPARYIQIMTWEDLPFLPLRAEEEHEHAHAGMDPHIWLDPTLMARIAEKLTDLFATRWPQHITRLQSNRDALVARLTALDTAIAAQLKPRPARVDDVVPYVFFHDAYQYFEVRYGLSPSRTLFVQPPEMVGMRKQMDVNARLSGQKLHCLFTESVSPLTQRIADKTSAKLIIQQPTSMGLGVSYNYEAALHKLADQIRNCEAPR